MFSSLDYTGDYHRPSHTTVTTYSIHVIYYRLTTPTISPFYRIVTTTILIVPLIYHFYTAVHLLHSVNWNSCYYRSDLLYFCSTRWMIVLPATCCISIFTTARCSVVHLLFHRIHLTAFIVEFLAATIRATTITTIRFDDFHC